VVSGDKSIWEWKLLTDPQILFLDEPTSGLSSQDALTVMKVLRQLADAGKTIY
jgi:ABC-type multidrug transport system ATPase subunit